MKMLLNSVKESLAQVLEILQVLRAQPEDIEKSLYIEKNIGKHIRHICDHFHAVKLGLEKDLIDYNLRNRGTTIEINNRAAAHELNQLIHWVESFSLKNDYSINQSIAIISEIDCLKTQKMKFQSSIARELLYLINHTIHHAAHIALICKNNEIKIPSNTGMAPCTMTFLRSSPN